MPQFSFLHVILGDEAVLDADARVYQRLLAMDDQEARAVAKLYLNEYSLSQLYDSVFMPALMMAERDRHKGALDPIREEFVFLSVKEMIVEFSERTLKSDAAGAEAGSQGLSVERRPEAPPGRILVFPASDEADEIAAAMLAQLLGQAGYAAISLSLDPALLHTIGLMDPAENDTFCISALPPFAFANAIALSRQLQLRYPRTKTIIGVWGFAGDTERALQRFLPSHPDRLVASLADAVKFVADAYTITAEETSALPV